MMLKTVYGPPPADQERIEATEEMSECALVREDAGPAEDAPASCAKPKKT